MRVLRSPQQPIARREQRRSGAVIVETAVMMPVFAIILLGFVEIGRAMTVSQLLNSAAREGGRIAVMTGSTNSDVTTMVTDTVQATISDTITPTVTITVTEYSGNPSAGNQVASANKRDLCTVVVSVPYASVSWLPADRWMAGRTLTGRCAMRHE